MNSRRKRGAIARIETAPNTSREHLLGVVFGPDESDVKGITKEPVPRAEEWIDLADAGPYIDETTVPIFSPNGDGSGGEETYGDPVAAARWIAEKLAGLPRVGPDDQSDAENRFLDIRDTE